MDFVWIAVLGLLVAAFVSRPLRGGGVTAPENPEVAALEAARAAKYREIKDAELDHRSGKLTDEDYGRIDTDLRREAVGILNRLEKAYAAEGEDPAGAESKAAAPPGPANG